MRNTRTGTRGFTLVEIMVSVGILSILLVGIFSLFLSTQEATVTTGLELQLDEEARRAVREMRRELRTSGWEAELSDSADMWAHNMVPAPVPTDKAVDAFGTASTSASSEVVFRSRIAFDAGTPVEDYDWTNDGGGTPNKRFIRYAVVADGELGDYRNIPGGAKTRYKIVRQIGSTATGPWTDQGFQIRNLESATFYRENWDTIAVEMVFMFPHPVGHSGAQHPDPIKRKVIEQIQLLNGSGNDL